MARLDVHPMPSRGIGYPLDVQADLLSHLSTRIVVPLLPETMAPKPIGEPNPVFEIPNLQDGSRRHVLVTQAIASIPGYELKRAVSSLAAQHDSITGRSISCCSATERIGLPPLLPPALKLPARKDR